MSIDLYKIFTYFQFEKRRKPPVDWDGQFCFSLVCCYEIMKPIKTAQAKQFFTIVCVFYYFLFLRYGDILFSFL